MATTTTTMTTTTTTATPAALTTTTIPLPPLATIQRTSSLADANAAATTTIIRCAIALNNTGCALLERNCLEGACDTFYDALRVLRHEQYNIEADDDSNVPTEEMRLQQTSSSPSVFRNNALRRAELRLIASSSSSSFPPPAASSIIKYQPIRFEASSPNFGAAVSQVRRGYCHSIRVDVTGSSRDEGDEVLRIPEGVLSAILLINCASAGLGQARVVVEGMHDDDRRSDDVRRTVAARSTTTRDVALARALTIIRLAHSIVEKCDTGSASTLFLVLLVLDTWIQIREETRRGPTGADDDALRTHLDRLCHHVETTLWFLYVPGVPASAA